MCSTALDFDTQGLPRFKGHDKGSSHRWTSEFHCRAVRHEPIVRGVARDLEFVMANRVSEQHRPKTCRPTAKGHHRMCFSMATSGEQIVIGLSQFALFGASGGICRKS